jgi:hypothetical protein
VACALAAAACDAPPGPALSEIDSASTVGDAAGATGCSTAVVIGLSQQIAEQANCEHPGDFVPFAATGGITFTSSAVLPYLDQAARDDLQAVAVGDPLTVNSGLRTLAQQYLLYQWWQQGACGITAAATVGTSNHEGGRAVDLDNYAARITAMAAHGWAHDVAGDPVHFDHLSSPDHRGEDIHAFQTLWNLNEPSDPIAADGAYGAMTAAKLAATPATGFAQGATCGSAATLDAMVVSIMGPETAPPQAQEHFTLLVKNIGQVAWSAATTLVLATDPSSPLQDPSWTSSTVITDLGAAVPAGQMATIDFDVTTPPETTATPVMAALALDDGGMKFGAIQLALTVTPDGSGSGSDGSGSGKADGGDPSPGHSGCGAGGGGGGGLVGCALVGLLCVRRRRSGHRSRLLLESLFRQLHHVTSTSTVQRARGNGTLEK